jgi:hypothetical protein
MEPRASGATPGHGLSIIIVAQKSMIAINGESLNPLHL